MEEIFEFLNEVDFSSIKYGSIENSVDISDIDLEKLIKTMIILK